MLDLFLTIARDEGARMAAAFTLPAVCAMLGYKLGHAEGRRIKQTNQNRRKPQ